MIESTLQMYENIEASGLYVETISGNVPLRDYESYLNKHTAYTMRSLCIIDS